MESLVWNGEEFSAVWRRDSTYYFRRVDGTGAPLDGVKVLADGPTNFGSNGPHRRAAHVWTGSGYGVVMSMCLTHTGSCELEFAVLDPFGNVVSQSPLAEGTENPALAWTGSEYGVIWQLEGAPGTWFTRVGALGGAFGDPLQLTLGSSWQSGPRVIWTGDEFGVTVEPANLPVGDSVWFFRVGCNCQDVDADGTSTCDYDCDDDAATVYPGAAEINDGIDNQCPEDLGWGLVDELDHAGFDDAGEPDAFSWDEQPGATAYEVARSTSRDFSTDCWGVVTSETVVIDDETPGAGGVFFYLVRAFAPNAGSWGRRSNGAERTGACLPG
jgi:hypothetical protein